MEVTLAGLPAKYILFEDELYLAVKQSDIDSLMYTKHFVIKELLTQEMTQNE